MKPVATLRILRSFVNPRRHVRRIYQCPLRGAGGGDRCAGGCGFLKHPNPPPHFKDADKAFCCALCRSSRGRSHGGHCPGKNGAALANAAAAAAGGGAGSGGGDASTKNGKGRQSAPKAFGTNDHGDGLGTPALL